MKARYARWAGLIGVILLGGLILTGMEQGLSQQGSPPLITFIDFPEEIAADGSEVTGYVGFEDPDGDLAKAEFEVVQAVDFQPFTVEPKVEGLTKGVFDFTISTTTPQEVTLRLTLIDEAGNRSEPKVFSFKAVGQGQPAPGQYTVCPTGCSYTSIQSAIEAAQPNDVITVGPGRYEENLMVTKSLTLQGAGRQRTIIRGVELGKPVVRIESETRIEVIITDFTITGAKPIPDHLCAVFSRQPLQYLCPGGIEVWGAVQATVKNNTITNNADNGVDSLHGADVEIRNNVIERNAYEGIMVEDRAKAKIVDNIIKESGQVGILIYVGSKAEIRGNQITKTTASNDVGDGIAVIDASTATIMDNIISDNARVGIYIGGGHHYADPNRIFRSSSAEIDNNTISNNADDGVQIMNSSATVTHNTIQSNRRCGVSAYDNSTVQGTGNLISNNSRGNLCPPPGQFPWPSGFGGGA